MATEPPDSSSNRAANTAHPNDVAINQAAANKRRLSTTSGSRGVTSLTPEQLNKKRANDREAQRAIRERTKNQIETLERRVLELTSQQPYQELQAVIRQKEAIQAENDEIRRRLSSALAILQPILNTQSTNGSLLSTQSAQHNAHIPCLGSDSVQYSPIHRSGYNQVLGSSVSPAISSITVPSTPGSVMTPSEQTWHVPASSAPNEVQTWSPVNALQQQKYAMAHGLELGVSGERLGFGFLMDKGQSAKLSNGCSSRGTPIENTGCHPPGLGSIPITNIPAFGTYQGHGSPGGSMVAHSAPVRNIAPTCPLDGLLLEFLAERRQQAAEGVPSQKLVGPAYPSVSSLLNPERSVYSHPLSKVFTDILRTFPDLSDLPEQVAVLYIMFLIMRWQISPTQENYDRLPDWVTPRPSQLFTPHPAWIDHLPWPHMRDKMVRTYQSYPFENFFIPFTTTLSLNWPYEHTDTLLSVPESEEYMINPVFERHLRNLHNWSLGPVFANAFPALVETTKIKVNSQRLAS